MLTAFSAYFIRPIFKVFFAYYIYIIHSIGMRGLSRDDEDKIVIVLLLLCRFSLFFRKFTFSFIHILFLVKVFFVQLYAYGYTYFFVNEDEKHHHVTLYHIYMICVRIFCLVSGLMTFYLY